MTTVAIIDLAHCGTTMLAGICEILGVPMVAGKYHEMKWEDHDFREAVRRDDTFAAFVEKRNAQHESWGFKMPGVWQRHTPRLRTYLCDPVYFAIYKDPVSVTWRRFTKGETHSLTKMRDTIRQYKTSLDGIHASNLPVHILSYHKAVIRPDAFVQQVAVAIGFDGDDALMNKAAEYIQPNRGGPQVRYPKVEPWI